MAIPFHADIINTIAVTNRTALAAPARGDPRNVAAVAAAAAVIEIVELDTSFE